MSTNCIDCLKNERSAGSLLCDNCQNLVKIVNPTIIIDAAMKLCSFVKSHDYPPKNSEDFVILTQLLDCLETSLLVNNIKIYLEKL